MISSDWQDLEKKKKKITPWDKIVLKQVCHFLKFDLLVFLEIAYSDGLQ